MQPKAHSVNYFIVFECNLLGSELLRANENSIVLNWYIQSFSLSLFFFLLYFYVFIWSNFYSPYHMSFILYLRVFLRYQEFFSCKRFFKLNQTIFDTNVQNLMNLYFLDIIYHFDLSEKPIKNICWLPVNVYDKIRTLI